MSLKISQILQENACVGVFKKKSLLKRDCNTGVFLRNLRKFYKHLLWRISANGCFLFFIVIFETHVSRACISEFGYVIIWCDGVSTCLIRRYLLLFRWLIQITQFYLQKKAHMGLVTPESDTAEITTMCLSNLSIFVIPIYKTAGECCTVIYLLYIWLRPIILLKKRL